MAFSFFSSFWKLLETSAALRNKTSTFHFQLAMIFFTFYSWNEVSSWPVSAECQLLFFHWSRLHLVVWSSDRPDVGLPAARWPQNMIPHNQAAVSAQSILTFPKHVIHTLTHKFFSLYSTSHLSVSSACVFLWWRPYFPVNSVEALWTFVLSKWSLKFMASWLHPACYAGLA